MHYFALDELTLFPDCELIVIPSCILYVNLDTVRWEPSNDFGILPLKN